MRIALSGYRITGTGSSFPQTVVSNLELAESGPVNPDWTEEVLGIHTRRVLKGDEKLSELVLSASKRALESMQVSKNPNLVIVATSTPDYFNPSMACILHDELDLDQDVPAFDIQAVCNGFLYALSVAGAMLQNSHDDTALIVGADQFSKITNYQSRNSVYFGDGAAAAILQKSNLKNSDLIIDLYADGTDWKYFHTPKDGTGFQMNPSGVAKIVNNEVPKAIQKLLFDYNLDIQDIDYFITHQPSKPVLDNLVEVLGIPDNKLKRNIQTHANTAGATVPSILDLVFSEIKENQLVCLVSFGSGWTWSVALVGNVKKN
jgi:3-oxoacyl-[acyl-carrier-protein] synthase III